MNLHLKNIGKLKDISVQLNGITVIAGENNTGKSTLNKTLFCILNSGYELQKCIEKEKLTSIKEILSATYRLQALMFPLGDAIEIFSKRILNGQIIDFEKEVTELFQELSGNKEIKYNLQTAKTKVQQILALSDTDIYKIILNKKINSEFNGQLVDVRSTEAGEICLQYGSQTICINITDTGVTYVSDTINSIAQVVYLDDPDVLSDAQYAYLYVNSYFSHKTHLKSLLIKQSENITAEAVASESLNKILNKLSTVCDGSVERGYTFGFGYKSSFSDKALSISNLSTGLKTFVIIKTLLLNNTISFGSTVILDEPETHLHPEWQLVLAEIIVLLHKEFNIHVILTTHSPYFLRSIEVFSDKYEVTSKCNFYLAENDNGYASFTDKTKDREDIYKKLAKPLQDLEDILWSI